NIDLLLYSINKTMEDIQELTRLTKPLVSSGQTTLTEANSTLIQTKEVLNNIRHITSPDSELYYELLRTLREVNAAARSTRALTDYLRRHPESVIYGK
ncbi:MAG: MCE family protein, partial [Nitrospirae bacterium]